MLGVNIRGICSYIPFVGRYFVSNENTNKFSTEGDNSKQLLHSDHSTWSDGIIPKLRQFGSAMYCNLFRNSLLKLFIADESTLPLDRKDFASYHLEDINIRDHKSEKPISKKVFIRSQELPADIKSPVVVFTHGRKSSGRFFARSARRLADSSYGVLTGDLLGMGENGDKKLNETKLLADVKNSILEGYKRSHGKGTVLMSHSMGTSLQAKALAQIFEEEARTGEFKLKVNDLILVSPWDKVAGLIQDFHYDVEKQNKIQEVMEPGDSVAGFLEKNPERAEGIAKKIFGTNWDTLDSLYRILELNKLRPPEYRLKNLNIIHGENDPYVSFHRSENLINLLIALRENGEEILPDARFTLIKDGDHFDMHSSRRGLGSGFPIENIIQVLRKKPSGVEFEEVEFKNSGSVEPKKNTPAKAKQRTVSSFSQVA